MFFSKLLIKKTHNFKSIRGINVEFFRKKNWHIDIKFFPPFYSWQIQVLGFIEIKTKFGLEIEKIGFADFRKGFKQI